MSNRTGGVGVTNKWPRSAGLTCGVVHSPVLVPILFIMTTGRPSKSLNRMSGIQYYRFAEDMPILCWKADISQFRWILYDGWGLVSRQSKGCFAWVGRRTERIHIVRCVGARLTGFHSV